MIYTTYFGKLNSKSMTAKITPIAICAKAPDGWRRDQFKELAPDYAMYEAYKRTGDVDAFVAAYKERILSKLDPEQEANKILLAAKVGTEPALVCYEKTGSFCHRNIVADWLRRAGIEVQEL